MTSTRTKVYVISGLGAGKEAFSAIDLAHFEVVFLEWIIPNRNESLESYALRMADEIVEEPFVLMGLSFGGMLATEIAKEKHPQKLVLVSTAALSAELPWYIKLAKASWLLKLFPGSLLSRPSALIHYFFGVNKKEEEQMMAAFLRNTSPEFLKWALRAMAIWKNADYPSNAIRFHGTSDRLIPFPTGKTCEKLAGGHFAVLQDAGKISAVLSNLK